MEKKDIVHCLILKIEKKRYLTIQFVPFVNMNCCEASRINSLDRNKIEGRN